MTWEDAMNEDVRARLEQLYDRFNARDIDAVLEVLHPDVDWPNGWEGGRERGREAVRAYWMRQWAEIDPKVEPTDMVALADGRIRVHVHQVVRDHEGRLISDGMTIHDYRFTDDGLIASMHFGEQ
jgi:nuclear transport factor 2 (NTF2) superfamily protein